MSALRFAVTTAARALPATAVRSVQAPAVRMTYARAMATYYAESHEFVKVRERAPYTRGPGGRIRLAP